MFIVVHGKCSPKFPFLCKQHDTPLGAIVIHDTSLKALAQFQ